MNDLLEIDGSMGEGGGQVLRTSLALSAITGRPIHISRIRLGRQKPGLMPQHLKAVQAITAISQATVEGDRQGSQELVFQPGTLHPGHYQFDIGTAGSTSLVLQTILLPLSLAGGTSSVTVTGGTHVPWSPCFHYLELHWLPYLHQMGFEILLSLEKAGFYPQGGGKVHVTVRPPQGIQPLVLTERGSLQRIEGFSGVGDLDMEIATRQKHQALRRLEPICRDTKIKALIVPSGSKGTFLFLMAHFKHSRCAYTALGERGKRAEIVADEAVDQLLIFLSGGGVIDEYLADQLLLPLALAKGPSMLSTIRVTPHLLTNALIIQLFGQTSIQIEGEIGLPGLVKVEPVG